VDRLRIFHPFQPLLGRRQMLQRIAQTKEIGIALIHGLIHLDDSIVPLTRRLMMQSACQESTASRLKLVKGLTAKELEKIGL
jgi:phosphoserine phosphatase